MATLFGKVAPEARSWWDASAAAVLAGAHRLDPVDGPLALENAACRLLGEELALRLESEDGGFDLPAWLATVADQAAERFRDSGDLSSGLLLHAIEAVGSDRAARTAKAHLAKLKQTTAATELATQHPWAAAMSPARPSGGVQVAVDGYGSRYLLVAPFQTLGDVASAHWYAWDIDLCDTQRVVAAAVFTDPDAALADWRAAVGTATTSDSELSPGTEPAVIRELLADCLMRETFGGSLMGDEKIDLLSEYFRARSRATQLSRTMPGHNPDPQATVRWNTGTHTNADKVLDEFGRWFSERNATADFNEDTAATLIVDWLGIGPSVARFSCSPHRISTLAAFIWDSYEDETAANICALLPEWVAWCAETTGLAPALTDRALAAARQSTTLTRSTVKLDQLTEPRIAE